MTMKADLSVSTKDEPESTSTLAAPAVVPSLNTPDSLVSANPWQDVAQPPAYDFKEEPARFKPPPALDPTLFENPIFTPKDTPPPEPGSAAAAVTKEVLSEFDPLASEEERAAREAWEASEGHPPPPRTPSPPQPPTKDPPYVLTPGLDSTPTSPAPAAITSPTSSFPSFASLARSFALPLSRSRPQSIDASARAVPSPATLSSFAAQQDESDGGRRADTGKGVASASVSSTPHQPRSATGSPASKAAAAGDGGFDFQKFLDQMKSKSAEPVSKYLRSFLSNFAKKTFTVNDQVKIINDFLAFIASQMRECDVWKNCSDVDFENAMEGMEKLVMNRLYDFTFTPQLPLANPPRPITTDDLERDRILSQRIALFGWLEEKHLDVPEGEGSKGFLMFAEQELLKINHYKAPRDKLICILNCCKVIFGLIRHLHTEEGADSFVPILIFVVLKANPEHLLSNVEFINRFRNPDKLQSEAGYYLSSLMGAVSFIESMDHTSLSNITQEEFEKNVEEAIQALPPSEPQSPQIAFAESKFRSTNTPLSPHAGEESAQPLSITTPSQPLTLSEDAKRLLQKTGDSISKPLNSIARIFTDALDNAENKLSNLPAPFTPQYPVLPGSGHGSAASMSGGWDPTQTPHSSTIPQTPYGQGVPYNINNGPPPIQTPYKPRVRRVPSPSFNPSSPASPSGYGPEETPSRPGPYTKHQLTMGPSRQQAPPQWNTSLQPPLPPPRVQSLAGPGLAGGLSYGSGSGSGSGEGAHISRTPTPALDFAGVQAQIDTAHERAAAASRETLMQIFPTVDVEVVEWVLEANDGDLGKSIEQLLDISGDS